MNSFVAAKAVGKAYEDLLGPGGLRGFPAAWLGILVQALDYLREYYPAYRVCCLAAAPGGYSCGGEALHIQFIAESNWTGRLELAPTPSPLPRALKSLSLAVDRRAKETCIVCGHKIVPGDNEGMCALCTCKARIRNSRKYL